MERPETTGNDPKPPIKLIKDTETSHRLKLYDLKIGSSTKFYLIWFKNKKVLGF